ncbi:hypothetical protein WJX72_011961 [[Myrmecia] bisecta]|uniref:Uncharacterized protein n=1 Tax=[Myrmecia] bisecta TaxID=41462 RepID=A0AAW1RA74_9CHLO
MKVAQRTLQNVLLRGTPCLPVRPALSSQACCAATAAQRRASSAAQPSRAARSEDMLAETEQMAINPFSGVILGPADEADPPMYLNVDEMKELGMEIPPDVDPNDPAAREAREAPHPNWPHAQPNKPTRGPGTVEDPTNLKPASSKVVYHAFDRSSAGLPM